MTVRLKKYLFDVQMAVTAISQFIEGKTKKDYTNDLLLRSAVERQFEIVGEALKLATQEKENLELEIPEVWKIIGLRNKIAHGYDSIDDEALWDITQEHLPQLQQRLLELL